MRYIYCLLVAFVLISAPSAVGQHASSQPSASLFDQFYSEEHQILELVIKTDVKTLLKKRDDDNYQSAEISYKDKQGNTTTSQIKIRARGVTRKKICDYPPIKLKFDKDELEASGLLPFNKLKLVTQVNAAAKSEEYIFKEYLAYRLYNLLTPYSFRAQLIKVTYEDITDNKKDRAFYGILLEPQEELAARISGRLYEPETAKSTFLEKIPYKTMAVFQYMIGNTDWSVGNLHNLKLIKVDSLPRLVPIPYDFDYAGMVGAFYAVPHESLSIKSVDERLYRAKAWTEIESEEVTALFSAKKEAMLKLCEDFPHLNQRERKFLVDFLTDFFKVLEHPKRAQFIFGR